MPARQRFAVLKGVQGFGDRLQCLLQAIWYAETTGRTLVIDWRDSDWTHDPAQPLEQWFSLPQLLTMALEEFLAYWKANGHQMSVMPNPWASRMADPGYNDWIYEPQYSLAANNKVIGNITTGKIHDLSADVVVLAGVGHRSFRFNDLAHLELAPSVEDYIKEFAAGLGLLSGQFDVVHLRGGSKNWAGGKVPLQDLNERIHEIWPTKDSYLETLWQHYDRQGLLGQLPLYLVTDRPELADEWSERYGCGTRVPSVAGNLLRESGTHKLRPEDLAGTSVRKENLTLELLRDFVLMLHAHSVTGDGVSLFSDMAQKAKACGVRLVELERV